MFNDSYTWIENERHREILRAISHPTYPPDALEGILREAFEAHRAQTEIVRGWKEIGAVLHLQPETVRKRYREDVSFRKLVRRDKKTRRPWAIKTELVRTC